MRRTCNTPGVLRVSSAPSPGAAVTKLPARSGRCGHLEEACVAARRQAGSTAPGALAALWRPLQAPALLPLPELFQDLYLFWADKKCSRCHQQPEEPALCLVRLTPVSTPS